MSEPFRITGRVLPLALPIFLCGFAALIVALCGIHDREGWAIGGFFGALAVLFGYFVLPVKLQLDRDGVWFRSKLVGRRVWWSEVAALGIDWRTVDARLVVRLKRAARQPGNIEIELPIAASC